MLAGEIAGPEIFIKEKQDVLLSFLIEYQGVIFHEIFGNEVMGRHLLPQHVRCEC